MRKSCSCLQNPVDTSDLTLWGFPWQPSRYHGAQWLSQHHGSAGTPRFTFAREYWLDRPKHRCEPGIQASIHAEPGVYLSSKKGMRTSTKERVHFASGGAQAEGLS